MNRHAIRASSFSLTSSVDYANSRMEDIMQNVTTTRRRPLGITIIAILLFIQAVFEIVVGIFSFLGRLITNPISGLLVGWIPLAIGVLLLILAWGLWTLKPWAYW